MLCAETSTCGMSEIPNVQIQGAEPLLAKLPWNDGLAGTVPPAPTFETGDDHEQLQRRMRQQRQGEAGV
mgnify:CR=1 FL=1